MGEIRPPLPAKLFMGLLSSQPRLFAECIQVLGKKYGTIDFESDSMPWDFTDYYREEMGSKLFRKFVFFSGLIDPGSLARIKVFTNTLEGGFADVSPSGSRRRINIDPGYVTESKVVLATTKDFSHRIYIGENIYAEVTLRYNSKERSFTALDHTYFDFRSETYRDLFNRARNNLRERLQS